MKGKLSTRTHTYRHTTEHLGGKPVCVTGLLQHAWYVIPYNFSLFEQTVQHRIQWNMPHLYGKKFLIMLGGLHIEKTLWNAIGDL